VGVEVDGHPLRGDPELEYVHAAADGCAAPRGLLVFAEAVAFEDGSLAFGCAAAVAAHGGDEEGPAATGAYLVEDGDNHVTDTSDAAAAYADGDLHTWPDGGGEGQAAQAGADIAGDVGDMVAGEALAYGCNLG